MSLDKGLPRPALDDVLTQLDHLEHVGQEFAAVELVTGVIELRHRLIRAYGEPSEPRLPEPPGRPAGPLARVIDAATFRLRRLRFLSDQRGSGEAISFIFVLMVLLLAVVNSVPPVLDLVRYFNLTQVHRETLLQMELTGGFTPELERRAHQRLTAAGFDPSGVTIVATPPVQDYGAPVQLELAYTYTYRDYQLSDFLLYSRDTPRSVVARGSTVSFAFQK